MVTPKPFSFLMILFLVISGGFYGGIAQTTYTWQGGSGDWNDSNMWSPNGVPGSGDNVVINSGVVNLTSSVSINDLNLGNATLQGSGTLSVDGTMTWSAGEVAVDMVINGEIKLTGADNKTLNGHQITNNGNGTWEGDGDFRMKNGAVFRNESGAHFNILTSADIDVTVGNATWDNLGSLVKTGGGGQTVIECKLNNHGLVSVFGGELIFDGGGLQSGNFAGGYTTVLDFSGPGAIYDFQSGSSINTSGDVYFTAGTVNFAGTYSVSGKTVLAGGTLNILVDNSLGEMDISDGILEGDGNITISGTSNWTGGTIQGTGGLTVTDTLNISGSDNKDLKGRILTNTGTCIWSGTGRIRLRDGAVFHNQAGANFNIQNDEVFDLYVGSVTFVNDGTVTKSSTTGITTFETAFNNRGTVNVQSGIFRMTSGSDSSATYQISSGAKLQIFYGASHSMDDVTISGEGNLEVNGGTLEANGNGVTIYVPTALGEISTNSMIDGDGPVKVYETFDWYSGQIAGSDTVYFFDILNLKGNYRKTLKHRVIKNKYQTKWSESGDFRIRDGGVFLNLPGADFIIENDARLDYYSGGATFENRGNIIKQNSGGETVFEVPCNNNGSVIVNSGTLSLGGGEDYAGMYFLDPSTTIKLFSGVHRMNFVYFQGEGKLLVYGGTLWVDTFGVQVDCQARLFGNGTNIDGNGTIYFSDTLRWSGGEIAGSDTVVAEGVLLLDGVDRKTLNHRALLNKGIAIWSGDGDFRMKNGAKFINYPGANFDIQNDELLDSYSGGGDFENYGLVSKSAGFGTTTVEVPFYNSGDLLILSGKMRFTSTLENEASGTIEGTGTLDVSGGNFINDGAVSPGPSTGIFTIDGDYMHSTTASLNIELGGTVPGSGHDQLVVSQTANLNGTLNISRIGGFIPALGDSFAVMLYNAFTGFFQNIVGANVGGGLKLVPRYYPGVMVLVVIDTVNHPPFAFDDSLITDEDMDNSVNVLRNDYDIDGDSISIASHGAAAHGTVIQISDSSLAYYPALNFCGWDTFSYVISDGRGGLDTALVDVVVNPVNDPPRLDSIPDVTFSEDDSARQKLNPYVFDVDNDTNSMKFTAEVLSVLGKNLNGSGKREKEIYVEKQIIRRKGKTIFHFRSGTDDLHITIDSLTHIATFKGTADSSGIFEVMFKVTDPGLLWDTDTIIVTIKPRNDPPVISNLPDSVAFHSDSIATLNIWDYVEDIETPDSLLSYQFTASNDSLVWNYHNATGELILSAHIGFTGAVILRIVVTDDSSATAEDSLVVSVLSSTGIDDPFAGLIPDNYVLMQNYPNPFNPVTHIRFGLPTPSRVKIEVFNILGQHVATLVDNRMSAGYHTVAFDGSRLASGIYYYRLQADKFRQVRRMLLMK